MKRFLVSSDQQEENRWLPNPELNPVGRTSLELPESRQNPTENQKEFQPNSRIPQYEKINEVEEFG
jgi:hypothetical protein